MSPAGLVKKEQRRQQGTFHNRVLKKDGYKCTACGRSRDQLSGVYPDMKMLIADHLMPKALGGTDDISNGRTLCFFDNLRMGWQSRYGEAGSPQV